MQAEQQEDFFDRTDSVCELSLDVFTTARTRGKLLKDGYRVHKERAEDAQLQCGFDEGFVEGADLGRVCGKLYAMCRMSRSMSRESSTDFDGAIEVIDRIFLKTLPETGRLSAEDIQALSTSVLLLSCEFEPQLEELLRCMNSRSIS